ncbi:MAG: glutamate-5-semialdehyde dehydrogenase [Acaryochloris sp. RU_4_1]|nr:glutamate-5-semialdehyde dehydrogenase [Acaryochloris sp. RU_4_1]NJR54330.1 glutamate-5-semialdehyde dehydrogenase [Acaryochloris sp. CRU_2_0]
MTVLTYSLTEVAQQTRQAAIHLAVASPQAKNQALEAVAQALEASSPDILAANLEDCQRAQASGLAPALYARLKLDAAKLEGAIAGVRSVAALPDPVGTVQLHRQLDTGLVLKRVSCPLGVLGVIFEARPDAVVQIAALAIKSGNGVLLKGGQEALQSCQALVKAIHKGLSQTDISANVVALLTSREETLALLNLDQEVNLIIPRGSNEFVRFVQENTRIPVLGHAEGICHLYVDQAADVAQAVEIAVDSKVQYPAACNAVETILVHAAIAPQFLPALIPALQAHQVEVRGDTATQTLVSVKPATEADWSTEYSDLIVAIKVVESLEAAISHINQYGSGHTDAIATTNVQTAELFMNQVDAAGVFHNCSTRFADGFRYGLGAEVGISTQRLPPRGPVGLEGLVTYKYQLQGQGHIVASYSGLKARTFTHQNL